MNDKPRCPDCGRALVHYVSRAGNEYDYCHNQGCWSDCEGCGKQLSLYIPGNYTGELEYVCWPCKRAADEEDRRLRRTGSWSDSKSPCCGVCGRQMWESRTNGVYETWCPGKSCTKRRNKIKKQARKDESRIARQETDFATYTAALIDLQAQQARKSLRK